MFKHYLTIMLNAVLRNRLYNMINVVGLSFGLAATVLIALYVVDETSYDRQWNNAGRIYRINTAVNLNGEGFVTSAGTAMPVVPALERFFPAEIETGSRFMPLPSVVEVDGREFDETVTRIDNGFLDMFELEMVAGDLSDALSDPGKLALREDVAERFFGTDTVGQGIVGRLLSATYSGVRRDYEVAAIYRFPAGNSVLDLPVLTWLDESALPPVYGNWGVLTMYSYLQLREGAEVESVRARLNDFSDRNVDIPGTQAGQEEPLSNRMRFDLQGIADVHLNSPFDDSRAGGNRAVVIAFTAIAALVLLIGIINFTILSTARATSRGKEAALRRTVGASRGELIVRFLGESFCLVLPAMLVACALVELLLPVFEAMVGKTLQISWLQPATLIALTLVYLLVSVLGGLYPAFVLSGFRPAQTLRANRLNESRSSLNLRSLLVVFQFAVSIALIIATGVIFAQVRFAVNRDPGFNRENLLILDDLATRAQVGASKEALRLQISNLGAVTGVTLSSHQPTQTLGMANFSMRYAVEGQGGDAQAITTLGIDQDFFSTYQTAMVAGRDFSLELDQPAEIFNPQEGAPAPTKVIVNVSASRRLGFASPESAVGQQILLSNRQSPELTIIGVVADTNFYSMNAPPRAEVYSLSPGFTDVMSIRFEGDPQAVLAQVSQIWRSVMGDAELSSSFVEQNMAQEFEQERVEAQLLVSFSLLAIVIACLGLYGSAAFSMDRRTREIGIRKVMGAEVKQIVSLLVWQFSRPVLFANVLAWPLATWAMLGWLQRFPYRIDTLVFLPLCAMAGVIALSIAWLTVVGNTVKVANTKPVYALRYE